MEPDRLDRWLKPEAGEFANVQLFIQQKNQTGAGLSGEELHSTLTLKSSLVTVGVSKLASTQTSAKAPEVAV